jgi:hypothetical protein
MVLLAGANGCPGDEEAPATATPRATADAPAAHCPDHTPVRQAYFGELHLHSSYSMDAWLFDTRADADAAYRFARGETIQLAPLDDAGVGTRPAQLERPLDFASVTDHAEYLGPLSVCTTPGSYGYGSERCAIVRGDTSDGSLFDMGKRLAAVHVAPGEVEGVAFDRTDLAPEICGEDEGVCRDAKRSVWEAIQAATERHDSPCQFTTLHGYEYSAAPAQSKLHRNVIFRNATVPEIPVSSLDAPTALGLWRSLVRDCNDAGTGCEALSIPHNSNLSNGRTFTVPYRDAPLAEQVAHASLRARMEPLVEIMQIKGDSECRNGMFGVVGARDELCEFEKLRQWWVDPDDCGEGVGGGALAGYGCASRLDFVRYALIEGLREAERIGVNPYKLGLTASTDAHNGNPGDVAERSAQGWAGSGDASPQQRLSGRTRNDRFVLFSNPGGLVGVWAEENRREPIFDALQRREAFGTSGPRIEPRLFGGWDYPDDLCDQTQLLERAYAGGVPMGSDLAAAPGADAPVFISTAARDAGTDAMPGGKLQRIQIIKGWVGEEGSFHQAVYDVAGSSTNGARVDPRTCEPVGPGADTLCAVWRDPDFDPTRRSFYYARVVENPTCRWNAWQCLELEGDERPASCDDPDVPRVIQERAWTSPIWYEPKPEPGSGV